MRRHFIKPGISGWAQVNGLRGNLNQNLMEERVKYDLYYIKNWSIWVDFEILFKTILITILSDEAAY
jgi:putative colanic acid biosynthesis UDP-glucose lipid carrier transferase